MGKFINDKSLYWQTGNNTYDFHPRGDRNYRHRRKTIMTNSGYVIQICLYGTKEWVATAVKAIGTRGQFGVYIDRGQAHTFASNCVREVIRNIRNEIMIAEDPKYRKINARMSVFKAWMDHG